LNSQDQSTNPLEQMNARKLLQVAVANFLIASLGLHLVTTALYAAGRLPDYCRGSVIRCIADLFRRHWAEDSWGPMLAALHNFRVHPQDSIYQSTFFDQQNNSLYLGPSHLFQYPLSTLLPFWCLQRFGLSDAAIMSLVHILSWFSVIATAACAIAIAFRTLDRNHQALRPGSRIMLALAVLLISISFYPVMWAYEIGQIQVFGNVLFCLAYYFLLGKQDRTAGILVGLLALMKPQFLLLLAWAALRRRFSFAGAGAIVVAAGTIASFVVFGFLKCLDYIRVLAFIAARGESYFPNQSFNGLMNRLLLNSSSVVLRTDIFPPFRPSIYIISTLASAAMFLWAVRWPSPLSGRVGMADFSLVAIAATALPSIAWYHHYGILLPVFIWLFVRMFDTSQLRRCETYVVLTAYLLIANDPRITNLAANRPVLNLVQSSFFMGVLILMWYLRRHDDGAIPTITTRRTDELHV
jgi:alpha-1,2-mannosyltransferase